MTIFRPLPSLAGNTRGSGSAEFALVLPMLILFLLGIIDAGRFMYVTNMAEKATQMGARFVVVTDVIPAKLLDPNHYVGVVACDADNNGTLDACLNGGQIVSTSALGRLTCDSTSTTCTCTGTCPSATTLDAAAFGRVVAHMQKFYPAIGSANVVISFAGSGLGYAGDPSGMEVIPLVTVKLQDLTFKPITLFSATSFKLPSFATTLTDESAVGQLSN